MRPHAGRRVSVVALWRALCLLPAACASVVPEKASTKNRNPHKRENSPLETGAARLHTVKYGFDSAQAFLQTGLWINTTGLLIVI